MVPGWRSYRFTLVASALFACNERLVPVDDPATGTAPQTGDGSGSGSSPASAPDPDTTPVDSGGLDDLGGGPTAALSVCPPASVSAVGIDTRVRVTFATNGVPALLSSNAISVVCDELPISGDAIVGAGQLVFVPAAPLPSDAACDVELLADSVAQDGGLVAPTQWSFTTGSGYGLDFDFATPITISDGHSLNVQAVDADGDDVVFVWQADNRVTVARSNDRGESFELSPLDTVEGFFQMPDIHLQDGVAHVAWQLLDGNNDGECFYSRSEPGLGEMSEPLHLVALPQPMTSTSPSITTDGAGLVTLTWLESCFLDTSCPLEDEGLYSIVSTDGGASFGPPTRVLGREAWGYAELYGPRLGWVDGGVAGVWTAYPEGVPNGITFVDGSAGFSVITEQGGTQYMPELERTFQDEVAMHWLETGPDDSTRRMLARIHERSPDGIDAPIVIAEPIGTADFATTVDVHGDIVGVAAAEASFFDDATRYLKLSRDGGQTFSAPQWIDFMDSADIEAPAQDSPIPLIAIADDERAHLVWYHFEDSSYSIRYTHGDAMAPCGLGSGR